MIRYIVIEDEPAALRRLVRKLKELRPIWQCTGKADSISSGMDLLDSATFDLIFSDIELSDGDSFQIFAHTSVNKPIIFITAFDEYAMKAFDFNSIHYLLKPISDQQLNTALEKFESNPLLFSQDADLFKTEKTQITKKLVSRLGNRLTVIDYSDIAYIHHVNRATKAFLFNGKSHYLDQSLDALVEYLPDHLFFRISRQAIIQKEAVLHYNTISSNRIQLESNPISSIDLIVSKERVRTFKQWLVGK